MKYDSNKASRSAARKAHYAAGGTPDMWRGRAARMDEAKCKARQNKRACRGVNFSRLEG